ncbi:MAG: hypothetical protein ABUL63_04515 [Acidobacteriota bacterium]
MKTTAAILILIANLWSLTAGNELSSLFDFEKKPSGTVTTMQDPPDDGGPIFLPPPR